MNKKKRQKKINTKKNHKFFFQKIWVWEETENAQTVHKGLDISTNC
jgi:hypothetical protein